jgi:hypothetical protein
MAKQKRLTANNVTTSDWLNAFKPFDRMTCNYCIGQHGAGCCPLKEHAEISKAAQKVGILGSGNLRKLFPAYIRLRKRFAKFYPKAA